VAQRSGNITTRILRALHGGGIVEVTSYDTVQELRDDFKVVPWHLINTRDEVLICWPPRQHACAWMLNRTKKRESSQHQFHGP
jgi:hypothetical protein